MPTWAPTDTPATPLDPPTVALPPTPAPAAPADPPTTVLEHVAAPTRTPLDPPTTALDPPTLLLDPADPADPGTVLLASRRAALDPPTVVHERATVTLMVATRPAPRLDPPTVSLAPAAPRPVPAPRATRPVEHAPVAPRPTPSAPAAVPTPRPRVRSGAPRAGAPGALLADLLAGVLDRDHVSVDADFFDDLGADSMLMARFCARARKHPDLPAISIQDIYAHTTIAGLAGSLGTPATGSVPAPGTPAAPAEVAIPAAGEDRGPGRRVGATGYALCGALQLAFFLGYSWLTAIVVVTGNEWISASPGLPTLYLRSAAVGAGTFLLLSLVPILVKWVLVGRWTSRQIRVWSLDYVRFWIVKTLVRTDPLVLFAGSPLYNGYLRALGARIGPGAVILTPRVPVCTDLLTVGTGTVIRKDSALSGYRAHDGLVQTGPVTVGADVLVGEATVLDIGTSVGDGAQLGHTSALYRGQRIPAGQRWHGSPARPTDVDYRTVPPAPGGASRRVLYTLAQLALLLGVLLPVAAGGVVLLLREVPQLAALLTPGPGALADPAFHLQTLALTAVGYFEALLVGLVLVATLPRVLARAFVPDRVYPLYGVHYFLHRAISTLTNVAAFTQLSGDSSAIAHYLRLLGYHLTPLRQTGSNFGLSVKHENPYLTAVGSATVVADELSVMNAEFSATSFRVSATRIGAHNFLGNKICYPAGGRTGDDCLLATKVMVPVSGPLREGVGLLGSPSFEIPRTVARDARLDSGDPARLRAKNRHNGLSMVLHLLVRWVFVLQIALLTAGVAALPFALGAIEMAAVQLLVLVTSAGWFVLVERWFARSQLRAPAGCSIYDPAFWRHERFWKVPVPRWVHLLDGTPFKNVAWRLLGARVGARVFDDGATLTEKTFTTIGDGATLAEGSVVQCHSQEDGGFKSDHVVIGSGATLGVNAFIHYGTTIGDGAVLAADSFLMKGAEVLPGETWGGNPARELEAAR